MVSIIIVDSNGTPPTDGQKEGRGFRSPPPLHESHLEPERARGGPGVSAEQASRVFLTLKKCWRVFESVAVKEAAKSTRFIPGPFYLLLTFGNRKN